MVLSHVPWIDIYPSEGLKELNGQRRQKNVCEGQLEADKEMGWRSDVRDNSPEEAPIAFMLFPVLGT